MRNVLNVIEVKKVYKSGLFGRKGVVAVDDVSFSIAKREIVSLVGESGSGKTTLALMMLRLLPPTSGKIEFEEQDIWKFSHPKELKKYWQKVHGVFQDPFAIFNPFYKADRILHQAFTLMDKGTSNRQTLIREALQAVGLRAEDVIGRYPHQLSGGQRQRLMIARCYLLKPKLIIADEPVSMIDASSRAGILELFLKLNKHYGTAILFVTHDLGLAYYISHRIIVMQRGKIVEEGPAEAVLQKPQHSYTKKLIGDIPLITRKWDDLIDLKLSSDYYHP